MTKAIPAVMFRDAWHEGNEDGDTGTLVVSVEDGVVTMWPLDGEASYHIILDRSEWEAIAKLVWGVFNAEVKAPTVVQDKTINTVKMALYIYYDEAAPEGCSHDDIANMVEQALDLIGEVQRAYLLVKSRG